MFSGCAARNVRHGEFPKLAARGAKSLEHRAERAAQLRESTSERRSHFALVNYNVFPVNVAGADDLMGTAPTGKKEQSHGNGKILGVQQVCVWWGEVWVFPPISGHLSVEESVKYPPEGALYSTPLECILF